MSQLKELTVSIIGAGKVGKTFGRLFATQSNVNIVDVMTHSIISSAAAQTFIGKGLAVTQFAQLRSAQIYLLAVPDDAIADVCKDLRAATLINEKSIVVHCSGAKSSRILGDAITVGAAVASVHPVRSFADPAAVAADFAGTICSIEGDPNALAILTPLLVHIGAQIVNITAENKLLYHAGSVIASNYLVTLMELALQTYQAAGIPPAEAQAMAAPLAKQTLENVFQMGTAKALTGPIARGDLETVSRQLNALEAWNPAVAEVYRAMIEPTKTIARKK